MRILYVSHKVITFILNEVVNLTKQGHHVYILTPHNDPKVYTHIVKPFLISNKLEDRVYFNHRTADHQKRSRKIAQLCLAVIEDFFHCPIVTCRYLLLLSSQYPRIGAGIDDYFDFRPLFRKRFDVLYSSFSSPEMIALIGFLSQILDTPFVLAFRAHDIYEVENLSGVIERKEIIDKASALVTISDFNRQYLRKHLGCLQDIHVIHSAVDLEFFSRSGLPAQEQNTIVAVGRYHEQKGLIHLIRACRILAARNIPFQCKLIGSGQEEKWYRKEIEQFKIPNITFINYLDREGVRLELAKATVFVLPCVVAENGLRDILANALKEAMAMELPVVTSDVSGIEELVEDGISGILTPVADSEAIADAVEKLFADSTLCERMGKAGRRKIEKDFNITVEAGKLADVFSFKAPLPETVD